MKKFVFFGMLGMFAINTVAQDDNNLVTNPSFESTGKGKLKKLKQIRKRKTNDLIGTHIFIQSTKNKLDKQ